MKKLLIIPVLVLAISGVAFASQNEDKVNLCHKTHSDSNPFVVQQVNANEVQSHEANGDFLYNGPLDKNGHPDPQAGPLWCADNQPGDVCPNIDGKQDAVPAGDYLSDKTGECLPIPTDNNPPPSDQPVTTSTPVTPPADFQGK